MFSKFNKIVLFVLSLLLFSTIAAAYSVGPSTSVLAMAAVTGGYLDPTVVLFRTNLGKTVGYETWFRSKLSKYISMIDHVKFKDTGQFSAVKGSIAPQAAIVHLVRDFDANGGVDYEQPILRPLTGQGRIGTAPISGHGEHRKWFTQKLKINMRRHAVEVRDNEMTEQMITKEIAMKLIERGSSDLKDWFSRLLPFEMMFSLLRGYSENITDTNFGRGVSAKSHPNSYVQGYGRVPWDTDYTFDAGFETNYATALASLSDTSTKYFSAQSIKNMVYLARKHKIQPITVNGFEVFLIFIHSAQMRQLRNDPEWYQAQKDAGERGQKNQIFTGVSEGYLYEGSFIIVDDTIPAARVSGDSDTDLFGVAYDSTKGTVNYGVSEYMENPRDVSPRKPALLLGAGAVLAANIKGFKLTTEMSDHEQQIEDAGRMIYGFQRADLIDDDNMLKRGANLFYDNNTSLVYWTWSPDVVTI